MKKLPHFSLIFFFMLSAGMLSSCGEKSPAKAPVANIAASMESEDEIAVEPILTRQFHGCKAHQ